MSFAVYYPGCTTTLPDHIANSCSDSLEHGRVRSMGFVHKSYLATLQADPDLTAIWVAGIVDKLIIIIPEVTGTYDGGSPVAGPGYGDLDESLAGYKHVINYKDPNWKANAAFYNTIKYSRDWVPVWRTETQIQIADVAAQIVPKAPITDDLNSVVEWDVEVRFSQPDIPAPIDTPDDVFIPFQYF